MDMTYGTYVFTVGLPGGGYAYVCVSLLFIHDMPLGGTVVGRVRALRCLCVVYSRLTVCLCVL
jgi:hypothetical protein